MTQLLEEVKFVKDNSNGIFHIFRKRQARFSVRWYQRECNLLTDRNILLFLKSEHSVLYKLRPRFLAAARHRDHNYNALNHLTVHDVLPISASLELITTSLLARAFQS